MGARQISYFAAWCFEHVGKGGRIKKSCFLFNLQKSTFNCTVFVRFWLRMENSILLQYNKLARLCNKCSRPLIAIFCKWGAQNFCKINWIILIVLGSTLIIFFEIVNHPLIRTCTNMCWWWYLLDDEARYLSFGINLFLLGHFEEMNFQHFVVLDWSWWHLRSWH